jgi:diguanylate cyclase (GGDEF)-like protein/PAS domain S-box-containing protein/putative nucleotidyltransferase with HDIG domain
LDPYVASIILAVVALVPILNFYLYIQYRQKYLVYLIVHWLLLLGKLLGDFLLMPVFGLSGQLPLYLVFINHFYFLLAASILLLGVYGFLERSVPKGWKTALIICAVGGVPVILKYGSYTLGTSPAMFFMAVVMGWSGTQFILCKNVSRFGRCLAGGAFLIWGFHILLHTVTREIVSFILWGYVLAAFLSLLTAIGMLFIYFDRMRQDLASSEKQFRLLAENARDIVFRRRIYPEQVCEYISPAAERITGYEPECFYQDPLLFYNIIHPDYQETARQMRLNPSRMGPHLIYSIVTRDNKTVWLEQQNVLIFDDKGRAVAVEGIARDITERRDSEQNFWYMNIHDSLTGLYNRLYFEDRMENLYVKGDCQSAAIVVMDVDGLKLINDTLGHAAGDEILVETAKIINQAYPDSDTIARIGGDEFAVILLDCNQEKLDQMLSSFNELICRHNSTRPEIPLGVSIGSRVNCDHSESLLETFKEAENLMYRNRLKNSNIARIAIIDALSRAIREKDYDAKDHSKAMADLMILMGKNLGLSQTQLEGLNQLAVFHDIGKIGIPDHILTKPGPLSKEEMEEMRRHTEIGARIAQTSKELAHLSDFILKHHERWDGTGYPLALKGQEIPLECRIVALADSYDAMTSDRPYRPAMSHEYAISELLRCSGSQFDPDLVGLFIELVNEYRSARIVDTDVISS